MAVVNIPGVGRVNFPADMPHGEIQAAAQRLAADVGVDPNTGRSDPDLATVDSLMTGTARGRPFESTIADSLRSIPLEKSLPIAGATVGSLVAPGAGGFLARSAMQTLGAGAGGAVGGGSAEAENLDATAESIANAAIESGAEMAMAELGGLGLGAVASRAVAPNLRYLDPLKNVREDIARYTGEVLRGRTATQLAEAWRGLSQSQRDKVPVASREAIEALSGVAEQVRKIGRFVKTPIGGEVAEFAAVPIVAMLFGPGVALSLSIGKGLLHPGPISRYLTRSKLPGQATQEIASQVTRTGLRSAMSEEDQ